MSELSGGQKPCISKIACDKAGHPAFRRADQPYSGISSQSDAAGNFSDELQGAVLIVSHDQVFLRPRRE